MNNIYLLLLDIFKREREKERERERKLNVDNFKGRRWSSSTPCYL